VVLTYPSGLSHTKFNKRMLALCEVNGNRTKKITVVSLRPVTCIRSSGSRLFITEMNVT